MKLSNRTDGGPGVEVCEIDVTVATAAEAAELLELVHTRHVLVLRDQKKLFPREYLDFATKIGTPKIYPIKEYHHPEFPEIYVSSNMRLENGSRFGVARTGDYWHSDTSFMSSPWPLTMLYMDRLPVTRRMTLFADMGAAYRALDTDLRELANESHAWHGPNGRFKIRECDIGRPMHELTREVSRASPDVRHPCVYQHPVTGEWVLYVNEGFTSRLEGLSSSSSNATLQDFFEVTRAQQQEHEWRKGDILIWDNRSVAHCSGGVSDNSPYVSFRISMEDGYPFALPRR